MTGDAKLGLLVGVGLVVAAALVYYRPDNVQAQGTETAAKAAAAQDDMYRTVQLSPSPKAEQN